MPEILQHTPFTLTGATVYVNQGAHNERKERRFAQRLWPTSRREAAPGTARATCGPARSSV